MTAHDVQTAATEPQIGAVLEPAHGAEILVPLTLNDAHEISLDENITVSITSSARVTRGQPT